VRPGGGSAARGAEGVAQLSLPVGLTHSSCPSPQQIQSLKNLGLDIARADIGEESRSAGKNRFFVTDAKTSDKIVLSERLEEIRATIIQNMLMYHPESRDSLAAGRRPGSGADQQLGARPKPNIETRITIGADPSGSRTCMQVVTTDRPGLLVDIVKTLKDCSLNVISANVNTKGLAAEDTFYLTHRGKALSKNMDTLVVNALQYYLSMAELEKDESY
jgi:UTP:GlnB (protein PII) uridylyltransferase